MRTVQDWLRLLDADKLCEMYMEKDNVYDYSAPECDDYTVGELKSHARKRFMNKLQELKETKIVELPADKQMIFFATDAFSEYIICDKVATLCYVKDIKENSKLWNSYGWGLTPSTEWLGYYIAETVLTVMYMYDILVEIIWEASFYGDSDAEVMVLRQTLEGEREDYIRRSGKDIGIPEITGKSDTAANASSELNASHGAATEKKGFVESYLEESLAEKPEFEEFGTRTPRTWEEWQRSLGCDTETEKLGKRIAMNVMDFSEYSFWREIDYVRKLLLDTEED